MDNITTPKYSPRDVHKAQWDAMQELIDGGADPQLLSIIGKSYIMFNKALDMEMPSIEECMPTEIENSLVV